MEGMPGIKAGLCSHCSVPGRKLTRTPALPLSSSHRMIATALPWQPANSPVPVGLMGLEIKHSIPPCQLQNPQVTRIPSLSAFPRLKAGHCMAEWGLETESRDIWLPSVEADNGQAPSPPEPPLRTEVACPAVSGRLVLCPLRTVSLRTWC